MIICFLIQDHVDCSDSSDESNCSSLYSCNDVRPNSVKPGGAVLNVKLFDCVIKPYYNKF